MATVIDLLRHLGERAAPEGENALAGHVMLPGATDTPLSLPLAANLVTAWSETVGRTTLGHHALALSAAQAGHAVALMGHGSEPHADLILLALSRLRFEQTVLWVTPSRDDPVRAQLIDLADQLGIRWLDVGTPGSRINKAHLLLATPHDLHSRLLQYHDRAWRWVWPRLRLIALPTLHRYNEARGGHLRWLLRRIERLADPSISYLGSLAPVADVESALERVIGRPIHVIAAPAGPLQTTLAAVWRSEGDRTATVRQLVEQLRARRLAVTVLGRTDAETEKLHATLGISDAEAPQNDARVAIVAGVPAAVDARQSLLRQGYRLLVLLAGDEPHEQLIAAQPNLLLQALPYWPTATSNPYIATEHLSCAATELPLTESEIDRWHMRELRDRLIKKNALLELPSGDLWQSVPTADDPYHAIDPATIGGAPWSVFDPEGQVIGTVPPAQLDWCALPGQTYSPGLRVDVRDDVSRSIRLVNDSAKHTSHVISEIAVAVREELAARSIRFGKTTSDLTRGKVIVSQHVVGLWHLAADGTTKQKRIDRSDGTQWTAAACWIGLPAPPRQPEIVGWSIRQILPFVMLSLPCALGVTYDDAQHRLYIFETEPGGVGVVECMYDQFERVIELAHQLVLACAKLPAFTRVVESERVWLDGLRGGKATVPQVITPPAVVPQPERSTATPQPTVAAQTPTTVDTAQTPAPASEGKPPFARPRVYALPSMPVKPVAMPLLPVKPIAQPDDRVRPAASARPDAAVPVRPATVVPFETAATRVQPKAGEREPTMQPFTSQSQRRLPLPTQRTVQVYTAEQKQEQPPEGQQAQEQQDLKFVPFAPIELVESATVTPVVVSSVIDKHTAEHDVQTETTAGNSTDFELKLTEPIQLEHDAAANEGADVGHPEPVDVVQHSEPEYVVETVSDNYRGEQQIPDSTLEAVADHNEVMQPVVELEQANEEISSVSSNEITPRRKQPQRLPSQFLIDDLLPAIDEEIAAHEPDEQEEEVAVEPAPEISPIVELRPRPRTARPQPQERREPREPLPFRRPDRGSERDTRPAKTRQQETRYDGPHRSGTSDRDSQQPRGRTFSRPQDVKRLEQAERQREQQEQQPQQPAAGPASRQAPNTATASSNNLPSRKPSRPERPQDKQPQPNHQRQTPPERRLPVTPNQQSTPPPAAEATETEPAANVGSMIARMRRLREQREAEQARQRPQSQVTHSHTPEETVELRFHINDRVQCLPYGIGTVRASKLADGREMVMIEFPDYGEIEVDPGVSLVRKVNSQQSPTQTWSEDLL